MLYARLGAWRARARRAELLLGFDARELPNSEVTRVSSVNSAQARRLLRKFGPAVVVVNGTRIISAKTLSSVSVPFINMHAGITPGFRGVHGGYWALATGAASDCGVTVHLVDPGVDTGAVLSQARISPERNDNFFTYPLLQLEAGLPLLLDAVGRACAGALSEMPTSCTSPSMQWYHPALWTYIVTGLRRGVW
jgi:folate-dependent phosphoribosylglycinamide formyltransferase PurN